MSKISRGNKFKVWRSKQSAGMNIFIGILLGIKDFILLIGMGIIFIAVIGIIALFLIQAVAIAYSR